MFGRSSDVAGFVEGIHDQHGSPASLEANGVKKLIKIVYNLLIEPIQQSSFVLRKLGVSPVRLK